MPPLPEKVLVIESCLGMGRLYFLKLKSQVGQLCYQHMEDRVFKSRWVAETVLVDFIKRWGDKFG